jgi:hypothetical protein
MEFFMLMINLLCLDRIWIMLKDGIGCTWYDVASEDSKRLKTTHSVQQIPLWEASPFKAQGI